MSHCEFFIMTHWFELYLVCIQVSRKAHGKINTFLLAHPQISSIILQSSPFREDVQPTDKANSKGNHGDEEIMARFDRAITINLSNNTNNGLGGQ